MRVSAVHFYNNITKSSFKKNIVKSNNVTEKSNTDLFKGVNNQRLVLEGRASDYFEVVENVSNAKVGSKFIISPKLSEYKELRMLITPETKIESRDKNNPLNIYIKEDEDNSSNPSFKGRLYGSIRKDDNGKVDYIMQDEYIRFWTEGMYDTVTSEHKPTHSIPDCNFFIPSDGDGTRYKDITALQGGITKPASYIPASINGKQMSLVQGVISNFALTNKLDKMFDFVRVKPAQGSAYAFLEGLKSGQIPTDKPIVFSWGDNFSDINVSRLVADHIKSNSAFSLTVIPVEKDRTKSLSIIKPESIQDKTVKDFVEKPQDDNFIESCAVEINGKSKYLSAVGPYVISPQALEWIKQRYTTSPESFKSEDKGYDFSSKVIAPILEATKNSEFFGNDLTHPMQMHYNIIQEHESWSDLGSQKDFSKEMSKFKDKRGIDYICLPYDMKISLRENIDYKNNITFNERSRKMFNDLNRTLKLNSSNVIAYCKDDGLSYNRL